MTTTLTPGKVAIFVDRTSRQWVIRDAQGMFWSVPAASEGWKRREAFTPTRETELESVPGHYQYLLGLPN